MAIDVLQFSNFSHVNFLWIFFVFGTKDEFGGNAFRPTPDDVQIGDAVLDFYAALINLLGCCSPAEHHTEKTGSGADQNGGGGGGETQRVRAILQSLVPMEDLKGILGMNFRYKISKSH